MSIITSTVSINAPAEKAFHVVTDPKTAVKLIPGAVGVSNVPKLPLVRGSIFSWEYILLGLPLRGKWMVEEINGPNFYISRTTGSVDSRWIYTIIPRGKTCRLTLDLDYTLPGSLLRRYTLGLVEPHAQRIIDTYLASLKAFLELPPTKTKG
ncbi:MAG: SRPBCC family protein [Candidatus Kerfeldbacteria bacterium]|nr:SRPBCC family protein [Candidatus Kerfeldbacteria bacterium]